MIESHLVTTLSRLHIKWNLNETDTCDIRLTPHVHIIQKYANNALIIPTALIIPLGAVASASDYQLRESGVVVPESAGLRFGRAQIWHETGTATVAGHDSPLLLTQGA